MTGNTGRPPAAGPVAQYDDASEKFFSRIGYGEPGKWKGTPEVVATTRKVCVIYKLCKPL